MRLESDIVTSKIPARPGDNKALQAYFTEPKTVGNSKKTAVKSGQEDEELLEQSEDVPAPDEGHEVDDTKTRGGLQPRRPEEARMDKFTQLSKELLVAIPFINNGQKLTAGINPIPPMNETWVRHSKAKADATHQSFWGLGLLENHTFEWGTEVGPSRHRFATTLAQLCILEQAILNLYRRALLDSLDSAAAFLRFRIEEVTEPYLAMPVKVSRQATLTSQKQGQRSQIKFLWADRLSYDREAASRTTFDVDDELQASRVKGLRDQQQLEIQKVVNVIESSSCAWAVNAVLQETDCTERPVMRSQIQELMSKLVKVKFLLNCHNITRELMTLRWQAMSINAYLQRTTKTNADFDLDMEIPAGEDLGADFYSPGSKGTGVAIKRTFNLLPWADKETFPREEVVEHGGQEASVAAGSGLSEVVEMSEQHHKTSNDLVDFCYTIDLRNDGVDKEIRDSQSGNGDGDVEVEVTTEKKREDSDELDLCPQSSHSPSTTITEHTNPSVAQATTFHSPPSHVTSFDSLRHSTDSTPFPPQSASLEPPRTLSLNLGEYINVFPGYVEASVFMDIGEGTVDTDVEEGTVDMDVGEGTVDMDVPSSPPITQIIAGRKRKLSDAIDTSPSRSREYSKRVGG